jgi:hypothetical protein
MAHLAIAQKVFNVVQVRLFSSEAEVLEPKCVMDALRKFRRI